MKILLFLLVLGTVQEKSTLELLFEQKRAELSQAEAALEATYVRMEKAFTEFANDPGSAARRIADAIRLEAPSFQERLIEGRGGKPPTKAARLVIAEEGLFAALTAAEIDPGFREPLAKALSQPLLQSLASPELADLDERVRQSVSELFLTSEPFAAAWNDWLFQHVAETREFARAHAAYMEIGQRLERERAPERFDEGGQRLPPGMVQVKAGSYEIGPYEGWTERKGFGKRAKRVTFRTFFIDRTEVTNADYMVFYRQLDEELKVLHRPRFWVEQPDGAFAIPPGRDDHPVVGVSFNDALAFAAWAGKRLPSEDEWEAAARGPDGFRYPWGNEYQPGLCNDRDAALGDTAPVASFPGGTSPLGCCDMAGNVEEWTASSKDGEAIRKPLESNLVQVVIRGGNYNAGASGITTTFRWISPGMSTRKEHLGFRCALSAGK